jgi:hypothetical protein
VTFGNPNKSGMTSLVKALPDPVAGGTRAWSDPATGGLKNATTAGGGPSNAVFERNLATETLLGMSTY